MLYSVKSVVAFAGEGGVGVLVEGLPLDGWVVSRGDGASHRPGELVRPGYGGGSGVLTSFAWFIRGLESPREEIRSSGGRQTQEGGRE